MTAATVAKDAGQERSVDGLTGAEVTAFMEAIANVRPGVEFTVNDVRAELDAAGVPLVSRGGLFCKAAKAGLIAPAVLTVGGRAYPKTVPSTGYTAHAARVRVYVRTEADP